MDTKTRTLVKTISYRFFGMLALVITSLIFAKGSAWLIKFVGFSWTIGLVSFLIHERLWNLTETMKRGISDLRRRSLVKTITWRIWSLLVIYLISVYILKASMAEGLLYTVVSNSLFCLIHYLHERAWNMVNWGKKKKTDNK